MGETSTVVKTPKKNWFKGIKTEFRKIIWPDKETLAKQSVAVIIISILLGLIIGLLDAMFKYGIEGILKLVG